MNLDEILPDDNRVIRDALMAGIPGLTVMRTLSEDSHERLPLLLFNLTGSDDDYIVNGPGLYVTTLNLALITESDDDNWRYAQAIHAEVISWNKPGRGWQAGVGGVQRSETTFKFSEPYDSDLIGKDSQQSDATYGLLFRVHKTP